MQIEYFHVDAFTDRAFTGNPAGVCLLEKWLAVDLMHRIASEIGLSETSFIVPVGPYFEIRWFTPEVEVDLCGHGTLAAGHVLFRHKGFAGPILEFRSHTDCLTVERTGDVVV